MFSPLLNFAQGNSALNISGDVFSRYVWRGTAFSRAPSIQPGIEYTLGNLSIGAWGAYSFQGSDGAEADIYLSYSLLDEKISLTLTDYYFPDEENPLNNYFEYNEDKTSHILEASVSWNGTEKLPLSLLFAANFYGADAKKINNDPDSQSFNEADGNQYSMYVELAYSFILKDNTDLQLFAGFTPNDPADADPESGYIGEIGFYGDKAGFVNLGLTASKDLKISDSFSLPISSSLIVNPMSENVFLIIGLSL